MHAAEAGWLREQEHLVAESVHDLRLWLQQHGAREAGIWLVTWKKLKGAPYVERRDVLDELLCQGWIDGVRRAVDDQRTAQWVSPRRHTAWTAFYRGRFAALLEQGRVHERGLAAKTEAIRAGTWVSLEDVDALQSPADLIAALMRLPGCSEWFAEQAPSYRRNALRWLAKARQPETRGKRIDAIVASSANRRRLPNV